MSQYFEIPIRAIPKQAPRSMKNKKGGVTFFQPKAIKVAEHFIKNYIRKCKPTKIEGALSVKVEFVFQRQKNINRLRMTTKPDIDNLLKLLLDGLQDKFGIFEDDKNIVQIHAVKKYGPSDIIRLWVDEVNPQ